MTSDARAETAAADGGQPDAGGRLLLQLLGRQPIEGYEKSFKMVDGTLLSDRFLLGINRSQISAEKTYAVCAAIGMPEDYLADFRKNLAKANAIHFGFEKSGAGGLYKAYLEFADRLRRTQQGGASGGVLLHLAYKWDARDRKKCAVAKYQCYPGLSMDAILASLEGIYAGNANRQPIEIAKGIIGLAAGRTGEPLMYLDVREEGNPRRSFDINLHAAGLRVGDASELLTAMCDHCAIPQADFARLEKQVSSEKLGHLSGGLNREGKNFLTVYYEVGGH